VFSRRGFLATLPWLTVLPASGGQPLPFPPPRTRFHLFLLIGQSNMAGRGPMDDAAREAHPRVYKLTREGVWTPGTDPLHFDKPEIVGVGLGTAFATTVADRDPDITVGLVPCAVGGTPLERWERGGDLFRQAVERTRAVLKVGELRGVLWHQGENDALKEATARTYGERLTKMIADLRGELGAGEVPFVAGKLGEFLATRSGDGSESHWKLVNEQLADLPARVPRMAVVESAGLAEKGDGVHFDTPSLRELGRRYARAYLDLTAK
jgi:pimeloyl-ACP methyl ester carboxylesterase